MRLSILILISSLVNIHVSLVEVPIKTLEFLFCCLSLSILDTDLFSCKMISITFLVIVLAIFLAQIPSIYSLAIFLGERATGSLDNFIASEDPIALQGVLNNIGSAGSKVDGAAPGLIIASPSKSNPDCTYLPRS